MTILGEVELDADRVLHGWCWCPERPLERLTVDVLIDNDVVTSLVASRFREDVRHRKFGDGYHGFNVALTRHIQMVSGNALIAARERVSGEVFWHLIYGEFVMPDEYDDRMAKLREQIGGLARQAGLRPRSGKADAHLAGAFGSLGERLRQRAGAVSARPPARPLQLPAPTAPAASIIITPANAAAHAAAHAAPDYINALRAAARDLVGAPIEVILCDDGADPQMMLRQAQAQGLKFLSTPAAGLARRRNLAVQIARGHKLVFLEGVGRGLAAAIGRMADERLVVADWIAEDAARMLADVALEPALEGIAPDGFIAAVSRAALLALGGFDEAMDDGAGLDVIDLVLRASRTGLPVRPWGLGRSRRSAPVNAAAGPRFAARWLDGVA